MLDTVTYVTIKSKLNFGLYYRETIGDIMTWDSKYIINLYHNNIIKPDDELKKILNKTFKEIRRHNMKNIGVVFNGMKFDVDQPLAVLEKEFENISNIEIERDKDRDGNFKIFYKNVVIARLNKTHIGTYTLELEPIHFLHRNVNVFKTYNKLLKALIKNNKYFIKFSDGQWIAMNEN
jgi:hypothetical protein